MDRKKNELEEKRREKWEVFQNGTIHPWLKKKILDSAKRLEETGPPSGWVGNPNPLRTWASLIVVSDKAPYLWKICINTILFNSHF